MIKTNAGRELCTVESENGNTPLHSSCENGDLEIVKVGDTLLHNYKLNPSCMYLSSSYAKNIRIATLLLFKFASSLISDYIHSYL